MKPVFPHCVALDAGSHQANIRARRRSVSIADGAGSRSPGASAAEQCSSRGKPIRLTFMAADKLVLGWICWLFPNGRHALAVIRPETVVRWHRAGFRSHWRWKSRGWPGRPALPAEIRKLIHETSIANPLWGAPRIHGELLKLGFEIAELTCPSTCSGTRGPPSQGWGLFLITPQISPPWRCCKARGKI